MKKIINMLIIAAVFISGGINIMEAKTDNTKYTQVTSLHILVPSEQEALKIREEILRGKTQDEILNNFKAAAKKYSKCPSGADGGNLGTFKRGVMVKEFEDAAFNLPEGEVSMPVKTQFGRHLIYNTAKK